MMGIKVVFPGPLSTIQDAGRIGFLRAGITSSGVMDQEAYKAANQLVGNQSGEAVIEATLMGPTLEFEEDAIVAVTGADMCPQVDGIGAAMYEPIYIK